MTNQTIQTDSAKIAEPSTALPWVQYSWLVTLQTLNLVRPIDVEFAQYFAQQQNADHREFACWLATLVSVHLGRKHLCLSINAIEQHELVLLAANQPELSIPHFAISESLISALKGVATLQQESEHPDLDAILVLQRGKLYFARYWNYEKSLADQLRSRQTQWSQIDPLLAKQWLDKLFAEQTTIDWQKMACAVASLRQFSVITGGPGTGKTTTVTRLLLLLNALAKNNLPVVKLVAPTGKAAMRLSESIKEAKQKLSKQLNAADSLTTQSLIDNIVDDAATIHRLLGVIPHSANFRFTAQRRLPLDILIVDEASMVDLPLMAKLVSALPDHAKLILLGDKDQLASVEAGSVMGDICRLPNLTSGEYQCGQQQQPLLQQLTGYKINAVAQPQQFADSVIALRVSHRFDANSGIGKLATAVNKGDGQSISALIRQPPQDIALFQHSATDVASLVQHSAQQYRETFQLIRQLGAEAYQHVVEVLASFNRFRVLCALRRSEFGIEMLNQRIEQALYRQGLIQINEQTGRWYVGKPIMISANDYQLNLFNGDIGILLPDSAGRLKAWFIQPDGSVCSVFPNRLPAHENVYAMTIHKSQGSEFDEVAILLPDHKYIGAQSIVTRELVYTGITRARKSLQLYAEPSILLRSAQITTQRASGLAERLYQ